MNVNFYRFTNTLNLRKDDLKIAIIGKVEEIGENYFILKDEFGKIKINFTIFDENIKNLKEGSIIRVFCTKIDNEIYCDFFQNLEGLDLNLYKKIENLYFNLL
ncbi:MAG: hypothetical protein QXI09_02085 [Candidatus Aenigmatarchaeota archaeon]